MISTTNMTLTADIVQAFVGNNTVAASDLPSVISQVHAALANLDKAAPDPEARPEPAVSIKASVKHDAVTCLECGYKGKMLKRHLKSAHDLSEDAYRARWGLPASHPLTAPAYSERRRELAIAIGLGHKAKG